MGFNSAFKGLRSVKYFLDMLYIHLIIDYATYVPSVRSSNNNSIMYVMLTNRMYFLN